MIFFFIFFHPVLSGSFCNQTHFAFPRLALQTLYRLLSFMCFCNYTFKCNSGLGFLIWTGRFQILPQHLNWKFRTLTWPFKKNKKNKILCNGFYAFVSKAETPVGSVGATFMTTNTVKVQGEALRCVSGLCWNDRWCDFLKLHLWWNAGFIVPSITVRYPA